MLRLGMCLALVALAACGSGYHPPPRPDMRVELDLASSPGMKPDMGCINTACGGCSDRVNWDGKPTAPGDPCLLRGTWQCNGLVLQCSDARCIDCAGTAIGSVCGADGHTVIELLYTNQQCQAWDLNSAIAICNRTPTDRCVGKCSQQGAFYTCTAHCESNDGGAPGCGFSPGQTCDTLTGC